MEAGAGMLYSKQVVDGVVHRHGGAALRDALAAAAPEQGRTRCAVGAAVVTPATGGLREFDLIVHTPTPFWPRLIGDQDMSEWASQLRACYTSSAVALQQYTSNCALWVAIPLLGAGAGGAPVTKAAAAAAAALPHALAAVTQSQPLNQSEAPSSSRSDDRQSVTMCFVFQSTVACRALDEAIQHQRRAEPSLWQDISYPSVDEVGEASSEQLRGGHIT